jgi:hypothetical protein
MTDYAKLSDAELMALYKKAKDPFESALAAEGVSGPVAEIARSIYQQESSSGKNTKTSNAGAVGGMQIIPATFKSVADKDWDINDPTQNARAGLRYIKQLHEQAGGDPALTAAGYYGGPGGLEKARRGVAVSDPRNPNAPTTLQYGQQVASRIPQEKGLVQRGVEAVIPSANADEMPQGGWGKRADGSQKGNGFLGVLKRPDGNVSTEISVGVNIDGKDVEIPTLVPTLTPAERETLLALPDGQMPPEAIIRKAAASARQRMAEGKSPFAQAGEMPQESPYSKMSDEELLAQYKKLKGEIPRVEVLGTADSKPDGVLATAREGLTMAQEATKDLGKGFVRGAARIGNTIINSASRPVVPDGPNPLINRDTQAPAVNLRNAEHRPAFLIKSATSRRRLPALPVLVVLWLRLSRLLLLLCPWWATWLAGLGMPSSRAA